MTEKGTASGREQMLDAAESCLQRFGLAKTTIEGRDDPLVIELLQVPG